MSRYILLMLFFLFPFVIVSQTSHKDSLKNVLPAVKDAPQRMELLMNLMDASRKEEQLEFAKQLYSESLNAENPYYKEISLTEILRYYVNNDKRDTAQYYLAEAERELKGETRRSLLTFMKTMMDVRIVYYTEGEERKDKLEQYMFRLETEKDMPLWDKISTHYLLGTAMTQRPGDKEDVIKTAMSHYEEVIRLTDKMPLRYSILFRQNSFYMLCAFAFSPQERAQNAIRYMEMLSQYASTEEMKKRPNANKRHLLNACTMLAMTSQVIGKEKASSYYKKFLELNKRYPEDANVTPEYEYLYTSINYFKALDDYERIISLCDSMTLFLRKAHFDDDALGYLQEKISACDSLGMYEEAYRTYKKYKLLSDSIQSLKLKQHLNDLEIQQNVNQLVVEKNMLLLELEKNKIGTYFFLAMFLLALCVVFYIFFRLWRMKSLYGKLQYSNKQVIIASEKAKESERLKDVFIQNMCHEVRTPLNAINGFAELIAGDDVTPEEKKEFSRIIYENCNHLTLMMNNILEIAKLDSSSEAFPLFRENVYDLLSHEVEKLRKFQSKSGIEYTLTGDREKARLDTNPPYFSLIISHLLNNANKFTEKGSISVSFRADEGKSKAVITITDTGCGIPKDKQEWIFERFTKANDFVPGSGLGLYLCRMVTERLNGTIQVDSEYTAGARFVLEFPLS